MFSATRLRGSMCLLVTILTLGASLSLAQAAQGAPVTSNPVSASCAIAEPGRLHCFAMTTRNTHRTQLDGSTDEPYGYGPSDLQSAYRLPRATTTATIAIVDAYDDPTAESDLAAYRAQFGLPACTTANGCFAKVNQSGATSPLPSTGNGSWAPETTLDVDVVSAVCPTCHILLVEANDNSINLLKAAKTAATMASYVSLSFGAAEGTAAQTHTSDSTYLARAASCSSPRPGRRYGTQYPASSSNVVAVGGTSLVPSTPEFTRLVRDRLVGNRIRVFGGRVRTGCPGCFGHRMRQPGRVRRVCRRRSEHRRRGLRHDRSRSPGWEIYGGPASRLRSSPPLTLWPVPAGTANASALAYAHPQYFNDVTAGSTGTCAAAQLCTARVGWDGPTGLGTPNGIGAFSANPGVAPTTVTLSAGPVSAVTAGVAVATAVKASDSAAGASLSYRITGLPMGLTGHPSTGAITRSAATPGRYTVRVVVTDQAGASLAASYPLTVRANPKACSMAKAVTVLASGRSRILVGNGKTWPPRPAIHPRRFATAPPRSPSRCMYRPLITAVRPTAASPFTSTVGPADVHQPDPHQRLRHRAHCPRAIGTSASVRCVVHQYAAHPKCVQHQVHEVDAILSALVWRRIG